MQTKNIKIKRIYCVKHLGCTCKNITPQSKEAFKQQIVIKVPDYLDIKMNAPGVEKKEYVAIDPCIAAEIIELWRMGIVTTGCCCGHNMMEPYIGVREDFISKMKRLEYEIQFNSSRPGDEDNFKPKSI